MNPVAPSLNTKSIRVENLARVEGEGALTVTIQDGVVDDVKLRIFEPPRFFEAFLVGRAYHEAPDITARICGICPVAYQMSAVQAVEAAFGVEIPPEIRALRRLLYCGEWIESHALHIFLLHAPDFLGYDDAIRMAGDHPELVKDGLALKKLGNDIVALLGGREIHPINVRVGGFYALPPAAQWQPILQRLSAARAMVIDTIRWTAQLPFPAFERDYEFVALRHPDDYPMNQGRLVSNHGLDIPVAHFADHFAETQVPHSTALHAERRARGSYMVGPMARFNLNYDRLPLATRELLAEVGMDGPCRNPFQSIVVRAVEILVAVDEAIAILQSYRPPRQPAVSHTVRAGRGCGCTEAPRGILYHAYTFDETGRIEHAHIVPPTAQNQATIEGDLRAYVPDRIHLPLNELTWQCEQAIRNYDPCISCSTHFLDLTIQPGAARQSWRTGMPVREPNR